MVGGEIDREGCRWNYNSRGSSVELGKQCTCNVFNTVRALEIINRAAAEMKRVKAINI
jgi:hypothetical protein